MNGLVIITNKQKLIICLAAIAFIILSAFLIADMDFSKDTSTKTMNQTLTPEIENQQLRELLSSILPAGSKALYENADRNVISEKATSSEGEISPSEIIDSGRKLGYIFVYSDEEYLRPIYTNLWKQSFYQGWLYLPNKLITARHCLFTYTGGAGKIYDIEGQLGFYPNVTIDNQNYYNFLIYNFEPENVFQKGNEIIITGTPLQKGVQIISVKAEEVISLSNKEEALSVHLCTPKGYEIDFHNILQSGSQKQPEKLPKTEASYSRDLSSYELGQQNILLKQELSHFISDSSKPLYFQTNGSYQTANALTSTIDLAEALEASKDIDYSLILNDKKYVRPLYHPQWKSHYDREWCYIPRKMYLNMKKLFILPTEKDVATDLLGELGFFGKVKEIDEDHTGILVNNFIVKNISVCEDNILVEGTPSRTGLQILGINKKSLTGYNEYAVRLVTSDACEIDVDVIKN